MHIRSLIYWIYNLVKQHIYYTYMYICSAQSVNLLNLQIVLRDLLIDRMAANLQIGVICRSGSTYLRDLQIA